MLFGKWLYDLFLRETGELMSLKLFSLFYKCPKGFLEIKWWWVDEESEGWKGGWLREGVCSRGKVKKSFTAKAKLKLLSPLLPLNLGINGFRSTAAGIASRLRNQTRVVRVASGHLTSQRWPLGHYKVVCISVDA